MESKVNQSVILDVSLGLKNMGCDKELYRLVLIEYLNENKDTLDKLNNTIIEKRYAEAALIIHKVKSSSGSIGANVLYYLSIKLQKALDESNEDDIIPLHLEFGSVFTKLLEEIDGFKDETVIL